MADAALAASATVAGGLATVAKEDEKLESLREIKAARPILTGKPPQRVRSSTAPLSEADVKATRKSSPEWLAWLLPNVIRVDQSRLGLEYFDIASTDGWRKLEIDFADRVTLDSFLAAFAGPNSMRRTPTHDIVVHRRDGMVVVDVVDV
jgi:hypothetical protein